MQHQPVRKYNKIEIINILEYVGIIELHSVRIRSQTTSLGSNQILNILITYTKPLKSTIGEIAWQAQRQEKSLGNIVFF
jgi:hypothetical protein